MTDLMQTQYADSSNLRARANLIARHSKTNWFEWIARRLALGEGVRVLDVGCGPGWLWRRQDKNLPADLTLTLVDTSEGMLREAEEALTAGPLTFCTQVADAADLPFTDERFDIVLLMHMLYHLDHPALALNEAYRVLRPGGQVFVTTNTLDNMRELLVLGAQVFGGSADDLGAMRFSLADAERMMASRFIDIRRYDLEEVLSCTDPDIAVGYLLSMPPGNASSPNQQARLAKLVEAAVKQTGGSLAITRRTGLVVGVKAGG